LITTEPAAGSLAAEGFAGRLCGTTNHLLLKRSSQRGSNPVAAASGTWLRSPG
jgi:hypothetical protein